MKPFYHLVLVLLSWLVLSLCTTSHPTLGRNRTNNNIKCIDSERDALLQFKHGITQDDCGLLMSWKPHTDCCQWTGVLCSNLTSHVIEVGLGGNDSMVSCLKGKVSPSLGELKHLEHLSLSYNTFHGEIPHQLGNLSKLTTLDLDYAYNDVTMKSLSWISRLTLLRYLDLSYANLSQVTNWITIVNSLPSLRVLMMDYCLLPVEIPSSLSYLNSSSNIHTISLSPNNFFNSSILFQWLFNLPTLTTQLVHLDVSWNEFEILIPSEFANFHSLSYLDLSGNAFQGSVSKIVSKLCKLEQLSLANNNLFYGELPDCWVYFSQLTSLHLENNNFSGRIPASIGTLLKLQFLHLFNNSFSGPFPVAFESLTSLTILNLGDNLLTGNIPPWIGNAFQSLGALILRKNDFILEIPESICQLKNLQILDLATNHISGVIPDCIVNFTAMNEITKQGLYFSNDDDILFVSGASISDAETAIVSWKREEQKFKETVRWVKLLDLSGNELRGEIPNGITILNGLESLDLSKNKLSGDIPFEIGNLTALELLDLSNNHLPGNIPISLAKVTTLGIVNVSNNNLSGEIPVSTQLQSFNASSYAGNEGLCGAPLPSCSKDRAPSNIPREDNITSVQDKDDDFVFYLGLYISVVLGFIVGFWGVCGTLVIKASWRHAYFRFLDNIKHRIM